MLRYAATADDAPAISGAYALLVALAAPLPVRAGAGAAALAPGRYLYCGSAYGPGGLRARLARHMRRDKRAHWHVDQITCIGLVEGAFVEEGGDECALNAALGALPLPLPGFGSSDCPRCASHLRFWPHGAELPLRWENARKATRPSPSGGE